MLNIEIKNKKIKIKNIKETIKDNVNSYICNINFSSEWNELDKTIVFKQGESVQYVPYINETITIPHDCLKSTEALYIGAFGVKLNIENKVEKRYVTNLEYLPVYGGAYLKQTDSTIEEGNVYDKYIAEINKKINEIIGYVEQVNTAKNLVEEYKTQTGAIRDDAQRIHQEVIANLKTVQDNANKALTAAQNSEKSAQNSVASAQNSANSATSAQNSANTCTEILKTLENIQPDGSNFHTHQIGSIIGLKEELDKVFQSGSNGKKIIADSITAKGVQTPINATFSTMASNISKIQTGININNTKDIQILLKEAVLSGDVIRIENLKSDFDPKVLGDFKSSKKNILKYNVSVDEKNVVIIWNDVGYSSCIIQRYNLENGQYNKVFEKVIDSDNPKRTFSTNANNDVFFTANWDSGDYQSTGQTIYFWDEKTKTYVEGTFQDENIYRGERNQLHLVFNPDKRKAIFVFQEHTSSNEYIYICIVNIDYDLKKCTVNRKFRVEYGDVKKIIYFGNDVYINTNDFSNSSLNRIVKVKILDNGEIVTPVNYIYYTNQATKNYLYITNLLSDKTIYRDSSDSSLHYVLNSSTRENVIDISDRMFCSDILTELGSDIRWDFDFKGDSNLEYIVLKYSSNATNGMDKQGMFRAVQIDKDNYKNYKLYNTKGEASSFNLTDLESGGSITAYKYLGNTEDLVGSNNIKFNQIFHFNPNSYFSTHASGTTDKLYACSIGADQVAYKTDGVINPNANGYAIAMQNGNVDETIKAKQILSDVKRFYNMRKGVEK